MSQSRLLEKLGLELHATEAVWQRDGLVRSEALLRTTLDTTADGILVVSVEGETLLMNRRFRELWQVPDDLAETGQDDPLLRHAQEQLVEPDAFLSEVHRLYHCDDEQFDNLHFKGGRVYERFTRPLQLGEQRARLWSFRDMTERAQARQAVERERARLKTFIRTIPDLVWLKGPDGTYLACNPAFEALYGASEHAIVGKTDCDFVDRDLADLRIKG